MHHNPDVFESPETFDPDRWLPENESKRSIYSWLPFSIGPRGCIGRQFAMQEAKIGLAKFLRKFRFETVDASAVSYDPNNPTTAPVNMWMRVKPQTNLPAPNKTIVADLKGSVVGSAASPPSVTSLKPMNIPFPPVTLLYGTNSGTSLDFANTIAAKAKKLGFEDVAVSSLDAFVSKHADRLQSATAPSSPGAAATAIVRHLILVVTATYNGTPPDNASEFDKWMSSESVVNAQPLKGVHFGVFGCGNKQWRTYQAFPTKVNAALEQLGGVRFLDAGAGDANEDIDGDFAEFTHSLYDTFVSKFGGGALTTQETKPVGITDGFSFTTVKPHDPAWSSARLDAENILNSALLENRELQNTAASHRSTRHLEISVSSGYLPGDHLEVFPQNDLEIVESVAQGLGLALDATFIPTEIDTASLASTRSVAASLPLNTPTTLRHVLTHRADLLSPPTRLIVSLFAQKLQPSDVSAADALKLLITPASKQEFDAFLKKNRTLLDLMASYPSVNVSLAELLCSVSSMVPRRYSIASSPLVMKDKVSLAVGVVEDVVGGKTYFGQSSGFFHRVAGKEGVKLVANVKSCKDSFRAPEDAAVPLIMVCAGTGIAPFMGFLQDRKAKGFTAPTSETYLFFGCRNQDDFIYQREIETYVTDRVLTASHIAFSRSKTDRKKYVQHLIVEQGVLLWELLNERGGKVYVCGAAGGMAKDVRHALEKVVVQIGGMGEGEVEEFLESRYIEDVWG
ncbi:hypothetical protein HDU98_003652 [Podochytrium sp. JEL0797]|nr:hypothetical protein HDU98_003652 [Podochytrium sp. JEL0797]